MPLIQQFINKSIYNCDCFHIRLLQLPFSVHTGDWGHEVNYVTHSLHNLHITTYNNGDIK